MKNEIEAVTGSDGREGKEIETHVKVSRQKHDGVVLKHDDRNEIFIVVTAEAGVASSSGTEGGRRRT